MRKRRPMAKCTAEEAQQRWQWLLSRLAPADVAMLNREATRLAASREDAEDAMQETLLRAVEHLPQLRREESLYPWLFSMLRRVSLDRRRECARQRRYLSQYQQTAAVSAPPAEELALMHMQLERFDQLLDTLDMLSRETVRLHLLDGFTFRQIAERQHRSSGTVRSCYRRAILRLREEMDRPL